MLVSAKRHLRGAAALVLALGMVGGAYAYAAGPAARGSTLKACYPKKGGDLRVTTHGCKRSERSVKLNPKGQRGPKGDTGAQGVPGQRGPTGPSHAYTFHQEGFVTSIEVKTSTPVTVASLHLGAGSYAFSAEARVGFISTATTSDCQLVVEGDPMVEDNVALSADNDRTMVPFAQVARLTSAGDVLLRCSTTTGGNYDVDETQLTAIKVGAATVETTNLTPPAH